MTALRLASGVLLSLAVSSVARGWPVLDEPRLVSGLRCYPDHAARGKWWYVPERLELAPTEDGTPAVRFHRVRYAGTSATGDSGEFWVKGLLSFRVTFVATPESRSSAERSLGASTLEPLPLTSIQSSLVYVTAGDEASESLAGGSWESSADVWTERSYTIAMAPHTTELLWNAYHDDRVALSLNYAVVAKGLSTRPEASRGGAGTDADTDLEPVTEMVGGGAIPIHVEPFACPACFVTTELDAEIPAGYAFLDVFCHDFEAPAAPSDLGIVVVDIRATAMSGERARERVRFVPGGPTRREVHFAYAVRIDEGYDVLVSRVYDDGRVEEGDWQRIESWTGVRDVTAYGAPIEGAGMDARRLY